MLTLFENGQPVEFDEGDHRHRRAADPADRQHHVLHHLQSLLACARPSGPQDIAPNFLSWAMNYFKSHGYQVIEDWSEQLDVIDPKIDRLEGRGGGHAASQDPARSRAAELDGDLKFPFPNPQDIFLHDTPDQEYFAREPLPEQWLRPARGCRGSGAGCSATSRSPGHRRRNSGAAAARYAGLSDLHHGAGPRWQDQLSAGHLRLG